MRLHIFVDSFFDLFLMDFMSGCLSILLMDLLLMLLDFFYNLFLSV